MIKDFGFPLFCEVTGRIYFVIISEKKEEPSKSDVTILQPKSSDKRILDSKPNKKASESNARKQVETVGGRKSEPRTSKSCEAPAVVEKGSGSKLTPSDGGSPGCDAKNAGNGRLSDPSATTNKFVEHRSDFSQVKRSKRKKKKRDMNQKETSSESNKSEIKSQSTKNPSNRFSGVAGPRIPKR